MHGRRVCFTAALILCAFAELCSPAVSASDQETACSAEVRLAFEEMALSQLQSDGIFRHPEIPYSVYVEKVRGRTLLGPVFKRQGGSGKVDLLIVASDVEVLRGTFGRSLLLRFRKATFVWEDGTKAFCEDRVLEYPLPPSCWSK
jgi:hypothetical protein